MNLLQDANGRKGWEIVGETLKAPFHVLAEKGDTHGAVAEERIKGADLWEYEGWDPVAQVVRDLIEEPSLIDSVRMATCATSAAVSVAGSLLTCDAALTGVRSQGSPV